MKDLQLIGPCRRPEDRAQHKLLWRAVFACTGQCGGRQVRYVTGRDRAEARAAVESLKDYQRRHGCQICRLGAVPATAQADQ